VQVKKRVNLEETQDRQEAPLFVGIAAKTKPSKRDNEVSPERKDEDEEAEVQTMKRAKTKKSPLA